MTSSGLLRTATLLLILSLANHAQAAESQRVTTPRDTASLVTDTDTVAPGQPFHLGLRLRMQPGWHTYWSNPGDAGAPPELTITGAHAGSIAFPAPERLQEGPFTSFAYTGEILLPLTATATAPAQIEATANWLICATVCVPEQARFHLTIPAGPAAPSAEAPLFAAAAARTPRPSPYAAHVTPDGVLWLQASLPVREALFFPADPGAIDQDAPQLLTVAPDYLSVALKPLNGPLGAISGVLRLTDAGGQVENLAVSATPAALPAGLAELSLAGAQPNSAAGTAAPRGPQTTTTPPGTPDAAAPHASQGTTTPPLSARPAAASSASQNTQAGPLSASRNAAAPLAASQNTQAGPLSASRDAAAPLAASQNTQAGPLSASRDAAAPLAASQNTPTESPSANHETTAPLPGSPDGSGDTGAPRLGTPGSPQITAVPPPAAPPPATAAPGLLQALLLAFAGGLILNLMPCVLPILALKAVSLASMSGASRPRVRREAAAYTAGVVLAFCTIGAVILGARAAGSAVGWGEQFQSAVFTTAIGWLLFATGLNMSGVFTIGASVAGVGQGFAARSSFATGLLAVVVATPCTAPFMGAALAAALSLPALAGMAVFAALGLGLAAPYAALALSPRAARLLPRPGAWMELFRNVLAFPMYAAALWLVWVAAQQTSQTGLALVFASFLLVGFAAWAYGFLQTRDRAGLLSRLLGASALASLAASALLLAAIGRAPPAAAARTAADGSQPYSPTLLASLRAAHRPVLVDMTAAWCVTCLVNEQVALTPTAVRDAFSRHHVAYLKGDWTRQDAGITAFLRAHDRSGVPLYVFYPASGTPEVLPQILTPGIVLARLDK